MMEKRDSTAVAGQTGHNRFLLLVAGLGGLLYGVDVGIIAGALPYLDANSGLKPQQVFSGKTDPVSVIQNGTPAQILASVRECRAQAAGRVIENVLAEVIPLLSGEQIHIGGDEAVKGNWKQCEKCQWRIKAEGLKDEKELESYFIPRIEKFINARGKTLIGSESTTGADPKGASAKINCNHRTKKHDHESLIYSF